MPPKSTRAVDDQSPLPAQAPSSSSAATRNSKFRPRGVRRGEAERDRIAQEQLRIQNKKIADDARLKARANRGRGRGRGGGIFSAVGPSPFPVGSNWKSRASQAGPNFGAKTESVAPSSHAFPVAVDDDHDDGRINTNTLYGLPPEELDDNDDDGLIETTKKKSELRPMATRRIEYKEEKVLMTSSREMQAQDEGQEDFESHSDDSGSDIFVRPERKLPPGRSLAETNEDREVWTHALPTPLGKVKIRNSVGEIVETENIDEIAAGDIIDDGQQVEAQAHVKSEAAPKKKRTKDAEMTRAEHDLSYMLSILGLGAQGEAGSSELEGHMLLFQFPPVLPPLKSTGPPVTERNPVKNEMDDDDMMLDDIAPKTTANMDLTDDGDKVKMEDDKIFKDGGFVGNLVVRKSGKVELVWGGTTFDMVPGAEAQFLSTAALVEEAEAKGGGLEDRYAGKAYGMGKIQRKFVLAPRFADEDDWVVDPAELEVVDEDMDVLC